VAFLYRHEDRDGRTSVLELTTPREIDAMRATGAFVAELLADLAARARWRTRPAA
jgi:hypothetical protein